MQNILSNNNNKVIWSWIGSYLVRAASYRGVSACVSNNVLHGPAELSVEEGWFGTFTKNPQLLQYVITPCLFTFGRRKLSSVSSSVCFPSMVVGAAPPQVRRGTGCSKGLVCLAWCRKGTTPTENVNKCYNFGPKLNRVEQAITNRL